MIPAQALYVGSVVHTRLRPRRHRLRYRCYWLLLDLDALDDTAGRLKLLSLGRFNLFSFKNSDYGAGRDVPLRDQVESHLAAADLDLKGGRIFLLTMPRILGYGFNPLSVYYCYGQNGALAALIYEVHNTFRQRHSYVVPVTGQDSPIRQATGKSFYVSPFLDMDLTYDFTVSPPGDAVSLGIRASDREGPLLAASLAGDRQSLTDTTLLKAFVTHPLLTLKVISAIHWEALRLWWKGTPLVPRPDPPLSPITVVRSTDRTQALHDS